MVAAASCAPERLVGIHLSEQDVMASDSRVSDSEGAKKPVAGQEPEGAAPQSPSPQPASQPKAQPATANADATPRAPSAAPRRVSRSPPPRNRRAGAFRRPPLDPHRYVPGRQGPAAPRAGITRRHGSGGCGRRPEVAVARPCPAFRVVPSRPELAHQHDVSCGALDDSGGRDFAGDGRREPDPGGCQSHGRRGGREPRQRADRSDGRDGV